MEINVKNMKAGYQGKADAMRDMAQRLMNHPGHAPDIIFSKSAADKEKMRPFKEGGMVKRDEEEEGIMRPGKLSSKPHVERMRKDLNKDEPKKDEQDGNEYKKGGSVKKCSKRAKFVDGGAVLKYRLGQMTMGGKQLGKKKNPVKNTY
jgi:hypothetical protein